MGGRLTRNFVNFHQPQITDHDFAGPRSILDNRYKLVVHNRPGDEPLKELFDVREDPAEENDLFLAEPGIAKQLDSLLRVWQKSVLDSLTGADYR